MSQLKELLTRPETPRGRAYRAILVTVVVLFVAGLITGGIGALFCNIPFMDLAQWFIYAELALVVTAIVIRGGATKPHPR